MSEQNDYRRKIKTATELVQIIGGRPRKQSVIMCHGTFDLVHPGHVRHLMYAKNKGDVLVASLTCDEHVSKADYRPFVPEQLRAMNLAALEAVDWVVSFSDDTPEPLLKSLKPDILVKGGDYTLEQVIGGDFVHSYDGEVKALEFLDNCSTSAIMEKLKEVGD